ncbi:50S ribosomal protein L7/L12 [Candidatus Microgenomates bacterium]|nr:50S ribosomal protein L7/L12 [Candidatus Microgenomates bacterium]
MADEEENKQEAKSNSQNADQATIAAEEKSAEASEAKSSTDKKSGAAVPAKFKKLVEEIEQLSVVELSELVKALEDRFGVSAAAPVAVAAAPAAAEGVEAEDEAGKKEVNIVLKEAGDKKIDVIKAVREISGLGLAESKAVVDGAPKTVKEKVPKDEAEAAKKQLEAAGAQVELE